MTTSKKLFIFIGLAFAIAANTYFYISQDVAPVAERPDYWVKK